MLKLTRPEVAPSAQKRKLPFKMRLHRQILLFLVKYYRKYAILDVVAVGRDIKIIRQRRDMAFEEELGRMHINLKLNLKERALINLKNRVQPRGFHPFISEFRFLDELIVESGDKVVMVERGESVEVSGSSLCAASVGSESDYLVKVTARLPRPERSQGKVSSEHLRESEEPVEANLSGVGERVRKGRSQRGEIRFKGDSFTGGNGQENIAPVGKINERGAENIAVPAKELKGVKVYDDSF